MPKVYLSRYEVKERTLPDVCMRCDAQALEVRAKTLAWCPSWVGVLIIFGLVPYAIVASILTRRMTVHAPFCEQHRNHWLWRNWFIGGGIVLLLLFGIAAIALLSASTQPGRRENPLGGVVCVGVAFLGLCWLIAAAIVQNQAIRATEITEDSITLTNVSAAFAAAVEDERHRLDEEYRQSRRRPDMDRKVDPVDDGSFRPSRGQPGPPRDDGTYRKSTDW